MEGRTADALKSYDKHDHLMIAVERGPPREDWRGLPPLTTYEAAFDAVLRDSALDQPVTKKKLTDAFVGFDGDLSAEPELTGPDKDRIAAK